MRPPRRPAVPLIAPSDERAPGQRLASPQRFGNGIGHVIDEPQVSPAAQEEGVVEAEQGDASPLGVASRVGGQDSQAPVRPGRADPGSRRPPRPRSAPRSRASSMADRASPFGEGMVVAGAGRRSPRPVSSPELPPPAGQAQRCQQQGARPDAGRRPSRSPRPATGRSPARAARLIPARTTSPSTGSARHTWTRRPSIRLRDQALALEGPDGRRIGQLVQLGRFRAGPGPAAPGRRARAGQVAQRSASQLDEPGGRPQRARRRRCRPHRPARRSPAPRSPAPARTMGLPQQ